MPTRNYIDLVEKTIRVLEILAHSKGSASLKQIASETQLVKSSAFRILYTLKELGYVTQTDGSGVYSFTWKMRALRREAAANATLLELARPRMIWLRDRVREAVWLAEWRGGTAVLVGTVNAPEKIPYIADIGSVCLLHGTATGKAIAAYLPRDVLREVLGAGRLRRLTRNTITSRSALRSELEQVRAHGYAMNEGETEERRIALAAPIFDSAGKVCASIASVFSSEGWNTRKKELVVASTKSAAEGVSQALAGMGFIAELRPA